jgi:tRNA 2-thiouridine synthesizing protein A
VPVYRIDHEKKHFIKEEKMAKTIDARGLSCPQPVLMTLNEIKAGGTDEILIQVDNDAAQENVARAAVGRGWVVADMEEKDGEFHVTIRRG